MDQTQTWTMNNPKRKFATGTDWLILIGVIIAFAGFFISVFSTIYTPTWKVGIGMELGAIALVITGAMIEVFRHS